MTRALVAAAALLVLWGSELGAADRLTEGRKHVKKANDLRAVGQCKPAVREYTHAYRLLRDPAILFNRAECHRQLGNSRRALADYRQYLADLPAAPNRRGVEERIEEIEQALAARTAPGPEAPAAAVAADPAPPAKPPPAPALASPFEPAPAPTATRPGILEPLRQDAPAPRASRRSSWVWWGLGALAVTAGGLAGWYALDRSRTDVPPSSLGNVRF